MPGQFVTHVPGSYRYGRANTVLNTRRLIYSTLLSVAVLGPVVLAGRSFVAGDRPILFAWAFFGGLVAIILLCVWCSVYVRDEPRLARIALIWIALLSLCFTIAVVFTFPTNRGDSKGQFVVADIRTLGAQLDQYKKLNGVYPTTEQGLRVPPKDPWSNDYVYRYPGKRHPNGYDLFSAGPDRIPDTADDEWGR